jgi:hypothetical protein
MRRAEMSTDCLSDHPGTLCADIDQLHLAQPARFAVRNAGGFAQIATTHCSSSRA